jgi:hypothetical protein
MGRGLSQQQLDILHWLQIYEEDIINDYVSKGVPTTRNTIPDYRAWVAYSRLVELQDEDCNFQHHDYGFIRDIYSIGWGGADDESLALPRQRFISTPEVRCVQASIRRSLGRLKERGLVELSKGRVRLTDLGSESYRLRTA